MIKQLIAIMKKNKYLLKILVLLAADILSIIIGFLIAFLLRDGVHMGQNFGLYLRMMPVILIVLITIYRQKGLYTSFSVYFLDEIACMFIAYFISAAVFTAFTFVYKIGPTYSRLVVGFGFMFSFVTAVILRYISRTMLIRLGLSARRVLLIGAGTMGYMFLKALKNKNILSYSIVGVLDDFKTGEIEGIEIIGKISQLEDVANKNKVEEVIIAIPTLPREKLTGIVRTCNEMGIGVKIIPDVFGVATQGIKLEEIEGILLLLVKPSKIEGFNAFVKRSIDIIISIVALIILSPLFAIIATMIKLDSPGPVFFGHKRLGKNGKYFRCLKFRTMVQNAQEVLQKLLESNPELRQEFESNFKLRDDPRITRVGNFLRKTSLDELPQLINVLKGEMSLVGPRPIVEKELEKYGEYGDILLRVKPGITGLWQVSGRNDVDYGKRVALDIYYIQNWSLGLDIKIILRTIPVVLKKEGAY